MIMCVLLCYPVSIRICYQQGGLFLVLKIVIPYEITEVLNVLKYFPHADSQLV